MKKVLLRFGRYENVTQSGQDGTTIQFPFSMVGSSMIGTPEEPQVTTQHMLRVGVAARRRWGNDEDSLAWTLFTVGKQKISEELCLHGELPELITTFVPNGECPVELMTPSKPEDAIFEIEIP